MPQAEFTSAEEDKFQGFPGNGPAVSGVGYDEPNYFSYVFKKRFGVTPSQFRK
ncbi:MAG TPA: AraC family transcriptional regulator [Candidatus Intestinimonas pullistercoris]|uniref:AraC family transcriptional regulator n=1 Tax=Candidatus Intestinimonas pullistercoris TaxID=2838623 RepID=A0A9D2SZK8_9FIRM|nr:AraC family transcriptional regulator [Candidatus Intestinimonas pullistercoris]